MQRTPLSELSGLPRKSTEIFWVEKLWMTTTGRHWNWSCFSTRHVLSAARFAVFFSVIIFSFIYLQLRFPVNVFAVLDHVYLDNCDFRCVPSSTTTASRTTWLKWIPSRGHRSNSPTITKRSGRDAVSDANLRRVSLWSSSVPFDRRYFPLVIVVNDWLLQVPILRVCDQHSLTESSLIVSQLMTFLVRNDRTIEQILAMYPSVESTVRTF